jgi:hypothetical protein
MVTVAVRAEVAELAFTLKFTVPLPVPVAPDVTTTHETGLVAVQPHPLPPVTVTLVDSPAAATLLLTGLIVYMHGAVAPLWVTVNVCPAMLRVPLRPLVLVLAETEKLTLPGPVTEAGDVTVIHVSFARAVHTHVAPALTGTEVVAAAALSALDVDESTGAHGAELVKGLDTRLGEVPPGPTAEIRAS